ncbi:MAG: hypothetical protein JW843_00640 [Candidatus Aminicenantes bacterium]|nr:hypothetical protein [Candidatus Aminicenantes bacterium]
MKKRALILALIAAFLLPAAGTLTAAETKPSSQDINELRKSAPRVYLDGQRLDTNYIKTEIEFVNYVRDRKEADVHVLISQQGTGGGGNEYTMAFIGLGEYEDLKNELKYFSNRIDTQDDTRKGIVRTLKLGLTPFVARTPMAQVLNLSLAGKVSQAAVEDPWNFWVFSISTRLRMSGEESWTNHSLNGNFTVNRVTPENRLRMGISAFEETSEYHYDDYQETSSSRYRSFNGIYVFSLGGHWSVGAFVNLNHSTYSNISFGMAFQPAIEFNIFPYSQSTRRELRIMYRAGYVYDKYMELTVYDKMSEATLRHALTTTFEVREPWGNAEISLEAASLLRDFAFNHFRVQGNLSVRLIKGLALTVDGRYAVVHDQLSLRKGNISLEELLLKRAELASGYTYRFSVGFSYSFGSVYSNVVNPRFGGGFGGMDSGGDWH